LPKSNAMNLTCIIVDDEPLARQVLEHYAQKHDTLQVLGSFDNVNSAFEAILALDTDLDILFLDLQLKQYTSIDVLPNLDDTKIKVIITSAYPESFLKNTHFHYFEWLQKPVRYEHFVETIQKVWDLKNVPLE
jgi:response regulator of citrate/malate metabolism